MIRLFSIRTAFVAVFAVILLSVSAWSVPEKLNEMTIKTDAGDASSRNKIETITSFLKGVQDVKFDEKVRNNLVVRFNPEQTSSDMVVQVLKLMGYNAEQVGKISDVANADKGEEVKPKAEAGL